MAAKKGKKCGNSHIPKGHKCSKGQAESASLDRKKVAKLAAMTGLAVVGGVVAYKVFKSKITDQEADSIISEAVAGGKKWGPFEALKKRNQGRCEGRSDANTQSRCRLGGGAYGNYYVHTSEKYGVKVQKEKGSEGLTAYEGTIQDLANKSGANVPAVLSIRGNKMVMEHLKDYQEVDNVGNGRYVAGPELATEARRDFIRSMKALHTAEIAHGDVHGSNVMINPNTNKMAIIDWGYATANGQGNNPTNGRSPLLNLQRELNQMPYHLGLRNRSSSVPDNFTKLSDKARAVAIKNFYTRMERQFEKEVGEFVPRSRLISNNPIAVQQSFELSPASVKAAQGAFKGNKPTGPVTNMERRVNAIVATGFDAKNKPSRTPGGQHRIRWNSATRRWAQAERKSLQAGTTPPIAEVKTWKPPGTDTINRDRVRLGLPELTSGFIRKYRRTSGGGKVGSGDKKPKITHLTGTDGKRIKVHNWNGTEWV